MSYEKYEIKKTQTSLPPYLKGKILVSFVDASR
jgi:hypothetical protein